MNKFIAILATILLLTPPAATLAEDSNEDIYKQASFACEMQADNSDEDYDKIFKLCMKMSGFEVEEKSSGKQEDKNTQAIVNSN